MKRILFIIGMVCLCVNAYAQDCGGNIDRPRVNSELFEELQNRYSLSDSETYELLGRTYLEMDNVKMAEYCFQVAVQLNPSLYLSWYNLGLINMEDPVSYFKKAIKANPKFSPPYYWLGLYYCKSKDNSGSLRYFAQYLNIADKNDPQEKDRIEMAGYIMGEIKAGNIDYDLIMEKAISRKAKQIN
ncbi:MAG: tetratricopeptide repeat protein [Candidatus Omnitrophica bacterium]|nr:tetratricopeptide repeat protein [Candidatus Omnitrophota bacterium]